MGNVTNLFQVLNLDNVYQIFDLITPLMSFFTSTLGQLMQFAFMGLDFGTFFLGFM